VTRTGEFTLARRADVHAALDEWGRTVPSEPSPVDLAATPLGLRAWATHFGDRDTGVLELRRDGRQVALLPIAVRLRRVGPLLLRDWASLGNFHWQFGYPIAGEDVEGAIPAMLRLLRKRRDWDVLEMGPMLDTSAHAQGIRSQGVRLGMLAQEVGRKPDPIVIVRQGFDDYYAGLSKNLRHKVRNGERRLEREGRLSLSEYTGGPDLGARLRAFFDLEASGWKGREGTAIRSDPKVEAFYTDLAREAVVEGRLRLYELRAGDQLIASDYCIALGSITQVFKIAYDEDRARSSPGQVMRRHVLQRVFERGDGAIYDLRTGGGDHGGYKLRWSNASREYVVLRLFNPATARGRVAGVLTGARGLLRRLRSGAPSP
jgi:CelD/BcsL family acetyltransferase involved in cellulose biosynthesis